MTASPSVFLTCPGSVLSKQSTLCEDHISENAADFQPPFLSLVLFFLLPIPPPSPFSPAASIFLPPPVTSPSIEWTRTPPFPIPPLSVVKLLAIYRVLNPQRIESWTSNFLPHSHRMRFTLIALFIPSGTLFARILKCMSFPRPTNIRSYHVMCHERKLQGGLL